MYRIILILILASSLLGITSFAQPPQAISYQTVVRDPAGLTLVNQTVGLQVNIRESNITGTIVYSENHFPTTNTFGLVNLEIGNGNVNSGQFDGIDWGATDYFIELGLDISGGTTFEIMGVSQILSVPYALYAKTAEGLSTEKHFVGELFGGGVVFYVYNDGQNGLIVSLFDVSQEIRWKPENLCGENPFLVGANSYSNGRINTDTIVAQYGEAVYSAKVCSDFEYDGYNDWYLPSIYELKMLHNHIQAVNYTLENDTIANSIVLRNDMRYWSSTSEDVNDKWSITMPQGQIVTHIDCNYNDIHTRAIRSF